MATVRINQVALTKKVRAIASRQMREALLETEVAAKVLTLRGPYVTGHLSDSIHVDGPHTRGFFVSGEVRTRVKYAKIVHNGSGIHGPKHKPYLIFPKGARHYFRFGDRRRPQLHFFWRKVGKSVFFPHIPGGPGSVGRSHPGQKGKHFLTLPMRAAARRHGFRFVPLDV
jgi:hypothetical protein